MPRLTTGQGTKLLSRFAPAVRGIDSFRASHANFWDDWNQRALKETGPLWVALGDSTSQGIGVDDPQDSWIPATQERLREETGVAWRVINLAITGGKLDHVERYQLPNIEQLNRSGHPVSIVTHLAGFNDLMAPMGWTKTLATFKRVLDQLPDGALVGRLGTGTFFNETMARKMNDVLEREAERREFELFWPWRWPANDGLAADRWHPGPNGYRYMADALTPLILKSIELRAS